MSSTNTHSAPVSRYFLLLTAPAKQMARTDVSSASEQPRKTRRTAFEQCPEHLFSVDDAVLKAASIVGR